MSAESSVQRLGRVYRDATTGRPLVGGVSVLTGAVVTGIVPIQSLVGETGGTLAFVGLAAAALTFYCGLAALSVPRWSASVGAAAIGFALVSLVSALGGYLVGSGLVAAGGLLCIKWHREAAASETTWATVTVSSGWRATATLVVTVLVGVAYFGAPVLGTTMAVPGVAAATETSASSSTAQQPLFPREAGFGGFVVFADEIEGDNYDHTGDDYRRNFETSERDSLPVGELRLDDVEVRDIGPNPPFAGDNGFALYKNYGGDFLDSAGSAHSMRVVAKEVDVNDNDGSGVGGADGEDYAVWAGEAYIGELEAYIEVGPIDIDVDSIEYWTCNVHDPDDDWGSLSDEREVDLLFGEIEIEVDPFVDSEGIDNGGLGLNVHRLEGQQVVLRDFQQSWQSGYQPGWRPPNHSPEEC